MAQRIREKISYNRKRIIPGLIALSLLSGVVVTLISIPSAQADFYTGCGYGYNSSAAGFGYGTGNAYAYGYGLTGVGGQTGVFGFGYGNQVCPPTTTTTTGGGGGGGGTTTTTTTLSGTTTTLPTTTTTKPPSRRLFTTKAHGFAVVGKSVTLTITGGGFYGKPKVTSNEAGTRVGVLHDRGTQLVVRVTVRAGSRTGEHTFTIRLADGKACKVNYSVK